MVAKGGFKDSGVLLRRALNRPGAFVPGGGRQVNGLRHGKPVFIFAAMKGKKDKQRGP
jgi:hypothetical protein